MRKYIPARCKTCSTSWLKASDSFKEWYGECRSCAMKRMGNRPDQIAIRRASGIAMMKRVGKLPHPPEKVRRGAQINTWRGGITPENIRIRASLQFKEWRRAVYTRDNFTCVICRSSNHDLEADHIKPFSLFPELRFEVDNGRTLCGRCHDRYGARVRNGVIVRVAQFPNWTVH